jgi:hypothetical protein
MIEIMTFSRQNARKKRTSLESYGQHQHVSQLHLFSINNANSPIIFTDSKRALNELSKTYILFEKNKYEILFNIGNCTTRIPQKIEKH